MVRVLLKSTMPALAQLFSSFSDPLPEMLSHALGNVKLGIFGPAVIPLGQADFLVSKWFPVGSTSVLFVGSAIRDVAVHNDQGRPIVGAQEALEGAGQHLLIIRIAHPGDIPAVA